VLTLLLVNPHRYARVAFTPGRWLEGLISLLIVYALIGVQTVPDLGGGIEDVPRFVLFGVLRAVLLGGILWMIGTQFYESKVSFWAVLWVVSAAHIPLLATIALPGLIGTTISILWFVAALAAAAQGVLGLDSRAAVTAGTLAVCGLLIVMAASPVGLTGVVPS
jgi:hypothetical protein